MAGAALKSVTFRSPFIPVVTVIKARNGGNRDRQSVTIVTAPIISIVEAKNENIKSGIPPCVAEMYAAQLFNIQKNIITALVYGVVTTGSSWKFMQLKKNEVMIDSMEYFIDNIGKILGILIDMINRSKA